jgi:hypothetical protein
MMDRKLSKDDLKELFWQHVPESIEGYSGRIDLLLDLLTTAQLRKACEIVDAFKDENPWEEGNKTQNCSKNEAPISWGKANGVWHKISEITGAPYGPTRVCLMRCGPTLPAETRTLIDVPANAKPGRNLCQKCAAMPVIRAEVHADDFVIEVQFDAHAWFANADDEAILALDRCGWGGDYPADAVAEWYQGKLPEVDRLFDHLARIRDDRFKKDCCGFECHVDADDALMWLRMRRPKLAQQIEKEQGVRQTLL